MEKKIFWFVGGVAATILLLRYYGKNKALKTADLKSPSASTTPMTTQVGNGATNGKTPLTIDDLKNTGGVIGGTPIYRSSPPNPSGIAASLRNPNNSRFTEVLQNQKDTNVYATGTFGGESTTSIQKACKCNDKRPKGKSGLVQSSL